MRHPIISDTTRTYTIELNVYGDEYPGWTIVEHCPVNGLNPWEFVYATYDEAKDDLEAFLA